MDTCPMQWCSQSSVIIGADGGHGHVLLQVNFDPGFEYLGHIHVYVATARPIWVQALVNF